MLLEKNVVGKKQDWANYITLADEHETPLLRLLPKGSKPVGVTKHYQADTYSAPTSEPWPDGKDWDTFKSAGANRVELQARCQWFVETAAVSKLAQDVTDTAGLNDELAHEIPKKMTEMARRIECAAGSDQVAYADDGTTGHTFRGVGKWISSSWTSDADSDVPSSILPAAAQVTTTAIASQNEYNIRLILESMWSQTGSTGRKIAVMGTKAKSMFTAFQFFTPASTNVVTWAGTASTSRVVTRDEGGSVGGSVARYESDWGSVELHMSKWNQYTGFTGGSTTYSPYRTYFLNTSRWSWDWNQKPTVYKPDFAGGSYKAAIDCILMLVCRNPIGEGAWKPAS